MCGYLSRALLQDVDPSHRAMDPSKRVCLKNLPPDCTKREIADFVRNRTGAQPHSIDLGLDAAGRVRRFAHFSAEGARQLIPALTGAAWRDATVTAQPARPHFAFRLAEARRRRERAEAEAAAAEAALWAQRTERWLARTGGEVGKGKAPKSFYAARQKYAAIAAEIAQRMREEHRRKKATGREKGEAGQGQQQQQEQEQQRREANAHPRQQNQQEQHKREANAHPRQHSQQEQRKSYKEKSAAKGKPQRKHPREGPGDSSSVSEKKSKAENIVSPKEPQQQQPTKEERKLSGLQAKLAALRAKMK